VAAFGGRVDALSAGKMEAAPHPCKPKAGIPLPMDVHRVSSAQRCAAEAYFQTLKKDR